MLNISKNFAFIVFLLIIHFYLYSSDYVKKIDYKLYDLTSMIVAGIQEKEEDTYSVIVDIDEKSIQKFGQWPWSRVIDAQLINLIQNMNPTALGVNVLFPEEDRLSPLSMQRFYQKYFEVNLDFSSLDIVFQDNDKLLSQAIRNSNATLPIYLQNTFDSAEHCQKMSYKKNMFASRGTMFNGDEILCNHLSLQDKVENFGFINADSDSDSIFRRVPLFIKSKEEVFPAFALAVLLSFDEEVNIDKKEDTVLINFFRKRPKVISASDILTNNFLASDIQGKVVILGSSVVGTSTGHRISTGEEIANSMIHAVLVDNILNEKLLIQPDIYKKSNVIGSLFLLLLMVLFLSKKDYALAIIIFFALVIVSILISISMYMNGIYISLGYLWTPFFTCLFFLIIYHLKMMNEEKVEQDKFLIRQSKLASMGEMISLIAHQWRQPLSSINGTVLNMDIDYRKNKLNEQTFEKYLNDIEGTTAYLSKTIEDFTDFFSKNKQVQTFMLYSVIEQAKNLSAISSSEKTRIIYRRSSDIEINGYASELLQSLLILFNNAIYMCQENLEIIGEGKIFIDIDRVGQNVVISVEDNGGGVAKKDMKKIFNPYFTTKEQHSGTGLGLYILKLIVEDSMNGKVTVVNGKEGAIFSIKIPINME